MKYLKFIVIVYLRSSKLQITISLLEVEIHTKLEREGARINTVVDATLHLRIDTFVLRDGEDVGSTHVDAAIQIVVERCERIAKCNVIALQENELS